MDTVLRDEVPADESAIDAIHRAAFADHPHSHQTEGRIVRDLRAGGDLTLSIVAEVGGEVVGHLAISPVSITDSTPGWFGLGPVAVLPDRQRRGIGRRLIEAGLGRLREAGGAGCVVLREPELYGRFGFGAVPGLTLPGVPPEFFLALRFDGAWPRGSVSYREAFA